MPEPLNSDLRHSGKGPSSGPSPAAHVLAPGAKFAGRFSILRLLAHGGMGSVYLATDLNTGEQVCLKLIRAELVATPQAVERFLSEGKVARRLSHPNIARVFDIDCKDGVWFIAMEFAPGDTLREWLTKHQKLGREVSVDHALWIARRLLHALHHLHGHKIVHRDIKPENIIVGEAPDGGQTLKLVDFGLARGLQTDAIRHTLTGAVIGTLGYMAPEQRAGMDVDARADLYSVAVILYELLTGIAPEGLWEPLTDLREGVPANMDTLIRRALSKVPERRPSSAAAMLELLEDAGEPQGAVAAAEATVSPAGSPPPTPIGSGSRSLATVSVLFSILALGASLFSMLKAQGLQRLASQDRRAAEESATAATEDLEKAKAEVRRANERADVAASRAAADRESATASAKSAGEAEATILKLIEEFKKRFAEDLANSPVGEERRKSEAAASAATEERRKAEAAAGEAKADRKKAEDAAKATAADRAKAEKAAADSASAADVAGPPQKPPPENKGHQNRENWRKLSKGMTRAQVKSLLGDPARVESGALEAWNYDPSGYVLFDEKGIYSWSEPSSR